MQKMKAFAAISAAFVLLSVPAAAQGIFDPLPNVIQGGGSTVIGPDGTYYALVPGASSTPQSPSTDLVAVGVTGSGTKWTATLSGRVGQVLPGATTVFVVESTTSGTGRNSTTTTTVALLSAASGAPPSSNATITPAGSISDIEVRNISGADYLYIYSVATSTSTSGNSTTFTTSRTLTIYSATGAVIKTVTL